MTPETLHLPDDAAAASAVPIILGLRKHGRMVRSRRPQSFQTIPYGEVPRYDTDLVRQHTKPPSRLETRDSVSHWNLRKYLDDTGLF